MGATFSRLKNWIAEVLTYADLNAEINNILNNLGPAGVDDYSSNTAQMREATDPGEVGTESLATSLAEELKRLRFAIAEVKGTTYWYESAQTSLDELNDALGGALLENRVISGVTSANSSAARFLRATGTAASLALDGSPTAFVYAINGTQYSISTDISVTGLSAAPASNNTALINDTTLSGQERSRWIGEDNTTLNIDTAGTEITALVGKYAAFSITNGGGTEYLFAFVKSATQLTNVRRGWFIDSDNAPVPAIAISNDETLTLLRLTWVFANNAGTLEISYTNPVVSFDEPSAPSVGDYWFDLDDNLWKRYNSLVWEDAGATLIGVCAQNTTNCIASRSFDFTQGLNSDNSIKLERISNTQLRARFFGNTITVGANSIRYAQTKPVWDITLDLETGISESASRTYYAYVTEDGDVQLSLYKPHNRLADLKGYYHPYELWRCVGSILNNGSSNFTTNATSDPAFHSWISNTDGSQSDNALPGDQRINWESGRYEAFNGTIWVPMQYEQSVTAVSSYPYTVLNTDQTLLLTGSAGTVTFPAAGSHPKRMITVIKGSDDFVQYTLTDGTFSHTAATYLERWKYWSDGTTWYPLEHTYPQNWTSYTPSTGGFGTVSNLDFRFMRLGDSAHIKGTLKAGTTAAAAPTFTLPGALNADTTKLADNQRTIFGLAVFDVTTAASNYPDAANGPCVLTISTSVGAGSLALADQVDLDGAASNAIFIIRNASTYINNNSAFTCDALVPMSGWTG